MNVEATDREINLFNRYEIVNDVRLKIAVSRYMGFLESLNIVPVDHIPKCMIYNVFVTNQ